MQASRSREGEGEKRRSFVRSIRNYRNIERETPESTY